MIKCIIVEDEPLAKKLLEKYTRKIDSLVLLQSFTDPRQAAAYVESNQVDLVFLDIEMPGMNGMDFFSVLPDSTHVIFTTAYSEYAIESYTRGAIDYLLKPIHFDRLMTAVGRVVKQIEQQANDAGRKVLFIKDGRKYIRLNLEDVYYVKGLKDYVEFITPQQRYIVLDNLKRLDASLPANFMRVHYSYIINCDKIAGFHENHIQLLDEKIPVSRKYQEIFMQRIKQDLL